MNLNKSNWKGRERIFARFFGGDRNPLSGMNGKHTSGDMIHPILYGEYKHKQKMIVLKLWEEVANEAKKENKIPVVGLSRKGMKGFLVVFHCDDFETIMKEKKK